MNLDQLKNKGYKQIKDHLDEIAHHSEDFEGVECSLDDNFIEMCSEVAKELVPVTFPTINEVVSENYSELEDAYSDYVTYCDKPVFEDLRDCMKLSIEWAIYTYLRDEALPEATEEVLDKYRKIHKIAA